MIGLKDGGFVLSWSSNGQDGSGYGVYAQRYAASGAAVGGEFRVNTETNGNQTDNTYGYGPTMAASADGGFVVAWPSNAPYQVSAT